MKEEMFNEWLVIARFGRPHGVKGWVNVIPFTEPADNIFLYSEWHVYKDGEWRPINLVNLQAQSQKFIAQLEGCDQREEAALLTNLEIAVSSTQLPSLKPGEYYWHDLVGMEVSNTKGYTLGKVTELMSTGSNDVLVIQGEKRHLLPYLPDQVVLEVNKSKKIMVVDWDEDF